MFEYIIIAVIVITHMASLFYTNRFMTGYQRIIAQYISTCTCLAVISIIFYWYTAVVIMSIIGIILIGIYIFGMEF